MRRKISFCLVCNYGAPVRQFAASVAAIRILGFFCLVGLLGIVYIGYDYVSLKQTSFHTHRLRSTIAVQTEEIDSQRKHIQKFGKEINALKLKLAGLKESEKKLRAVANIEPSEGQEGFFGMGGSLPEDIDTKVDLTEKHNSLLREMHEQVEQLHAAIDTQTEDFSSLLQNLQGQQNLIASTPAIRPTDGWITSKFGFRKSPFTGNREFHKGVDIATRKKTPILAAADGVVAYVGNKGYMGKTIVIDHGYGMVTRYGHIDKALKKRGDKVKRGDKIALVGTSGRTTGPHVHYEVLLNGIPVNPQKYMLN